MDRRRPSRLGRGSFAATRSNVFNLEPMRNCNYSGAQFGYPVVGSSASSPLSWVLSCHSRWAAAGSRDRALDSACVHFSK